MNISGLSSITTSSEMLTWLAQNCLTPIKPVMTGSDLGTILHKIISTSVASVNGQTGAISLASDDISEGSTNKYFTDARVAAYSDTRYVQLSGSYINPSWITSLPWNKITSTPTTLAGYNITDVYSKTTSDSQYVNLSTAQTIAGNKTFTSPVVMGASDRNGTALQVGQMFCGTLNAAPSGIDKTGIYFSSNNGTGASGLAPFDVNGNLIFQSRANSASGTYFMGNNGTANVIKAFFGRWSGNFNLGNDSGVDNIKANFSVTQSTKGFGTVWTTAGSTTVTSVNGTTQFTNTFKVGDTITVNGETRTISAITDDATMTTNAWTNTNTDVGYTLVGGTRFQVMGNGDFGAFYNSNTFVKVVGVKPIGLGSNITIDQPNGQIFLEFGNSDAGSGGGGISRANQTTTIFNKYTDANGCVNLSTLCTFGSFQSIISGSTVASTSASSMFYSQPNAGPGTISTTSGSTTVTGTNTSFTNSFKVGQTITANGETRTISAIASNTSMTTAAWTNTNAGIAYTLIGGTRFTVKGSGDINAGGIVNLTNTSVGNSATTGALQVAGGVGVAGQSFFGNGIYINGGHNLNAGNVYSIGIMNKTSNLNALTTQEISSLHLGIITFAGTYTTGFVSLLNMNDGIVKGAGHTITNAQGILMPNITQGTNNINIAIGTGGTATGNWSIYSNSTYPSWFNGNITTLGILNVNNSTAAAPGQIGALVVAGGVNARSAYIGDNTGGGGAGAVLTVGYNGNVVSSGVTGVIYDIRNSGNSTNVFGISSGALSNGINVTNVTGILSNARVASSSLGTTTSAIAYKSVVTNTGVSTLTNAYGFYASSNNTINGTGFITNNYGLYIEPQTVGIITNYAIYTAGTTPSLFGGNISGTTANFSGNVTAAAISTGDGADNFGQLGAGYLNIGQYIGGPAVKRQWYIGSNAIDYQEKPDTAGSFGHTKLVFEPTAAGITANISIRNQGGTMALTTDLAGYLPLTGGTLTDTISGINALFSGDVEISNATKGVVLRSANGARWRVTIDNSGTLISTSI